MKKISIQTEDGMDLEITVPEETYNYYRSLYNTDTETYPCWETWAGWKCTRLEGHEGEHIAHGQEKVYAVWEVSDNG